MTLESYKVNSAIADYCIDHVLVFCGSSTKFCVTSIFFIFHVTSIFLRSCGIGGRATCCHQYFSRKLKPRTPGTCRDIEQHYLRHNKNRNTNQLSDLKIKKNIGFH
jgi:hypothetical protein